MLALRHPGAITVEHVQRLLCKHHFSEAFTMPRRDPWACSDVAHAKQYDVPDLDQAFADKVFVSEIERLMFWGTAGPDNEQPMDFQPAHDDELQEDDGWLDADEKGGLLGNGSVDDPGVWHTLTHAHP